MVIHDLGSGPAVVCLHDAAETGGSYVALMERLCPRYRVIVPELPPGASVDVVAALIEDALAERQLTRLHAIVGTGTGAYRALHLALWRHIAVDTLVLLDAAVTAPALAASGPVPNLKALLSRLSAQVYLRVGEHGDRAGSEVIAAATGAPLEIVRGHGSALLAHDGLATMAAVTAAIDDSLSERHDEPPPRLSFRQPTG